MSSVWVQTARLPRFEALQGDAKTEVLIIGGGMAGLLCAHHLSRAGIDCMVVEAEEICSGATKNTTAKITAQHGLIYARLLRRFGLDKARLYLEAQQAALEQYKALAREMDCGLEERDSYVYSLHDRRCIDQELAALDRLGYPASFAAELPLPFPVAGAVRFAGQAQFHPLRFAAGIATGLRIHEHTKVREFLPGKAVTSSGIIRAEKMIIATHFPLLNKHGAYFMKLYQHRSYVLALRNAPQVRAMIVDEDEKGLSFRDEDDLLLLGGGGHRTGKKGGNWCELEDFTHRHYPEAKIVCRWAAQDCMSLDSVPYIGQYAKTTPDLYVATGFNKWGMTSSMAAAIILTDLVQGRESPWAAVFDPTRSSLRPQLLVNAAETTLNLLTPTAPRCPHMGCALKYNPAEHSWDCPCHGSRFTEDGALIDNPATDGKRMPSGEE